MKADKLTSMQDAEFTPMDNPCNLFYLRRAARAVSKQYGAAMKDSDVQATQFSVLFILSKSGALSITDLANKMGLDRTSMSRNLTPLQSHGYISVSDEGMTRAREVTITEAGNKALQDLMPMWRKAQAEFAEHLGVADTALLIELLRRVATIGTKD
ncbi:MAG: MarR family winged helix-turn-helix transcriptional regulator [Gammaproteobacteria bacterium]|nr:MarR family winged helix-turn-helix transcriptional regulator [Gammaproteobacteria bacterium]